MNHCVLSISSNADAELNLALAKQRLQARFEDIVFSASLETKPFGLGYKSNFWNIAAVFQTDLEFDVLNQELKLLEQDLGRTSELKAQKIVPLDVDIILWNREVVREDYNRFPFLRELISEIV